MEYIYIYIYIYNYKESMEYNNHLILRRTKVAEKATLKITIIEKFSEIKPPKLKRLVNQN